MPKLRKPPAEALAAIESDHIPPTEDIVIELPEDEIEPMASLLEPEPQPEPDDDDAVQRSVQATQHAEELQRQLAEANRQRDEAIRNARVREDELSRDRDDAQFNSVLTALAAEQTALAKAKSDYAALAQAGEWTEAAQAQEQMAIAAARVDRLEEAKRSFDNQRKEKKPDPAPEPAPQGFEARIANLPDTAKTWLRAHPEFINDQAKNDRIGSAHNYITKNKGIAAWTPEYFEALDAEFGFKKAPTHEPPAPQRRSMPVSAPVTREVPTASGQRQASKSITLTAEERLIARNSFGAIKDADGKLVDLTNEQKEMLYAKNKQKYQAMLANGQYQDARHQR